MADDANEPETTPLPVANPTGPYKFSEEGRAPDSLQAVNDDGEGEPPLPNPNEPPPYKKGL